MHRRHSLYCTKCCTNCFSIIKNLLSKLIYFYFRPAYKASVNAIANFALGSVSNPTHLASSGSSISASSYSPAASSAALTTATASRLTAPGMLFIKHINSSCLYLAIVKISNANAHVHFWIWTLINVFSFLNDINKD